MTNITILNGIQNDKYSMYEKELHEFANSNKSQNIKIFDLRKMNIAYCRGCWNCWVKTPGECIFNDDQTDILRNIVRSELLVFLTPITMGFITYQLKKTQDRLIPLIHPYIEIYNNESHHRRRYEKLPKLGLIVIKDDNFTQDDYDIIHNSFERFSLNFREDLIFSNIAYNNMEVLKNEIINF